MSTQIKTNPVTLNLTAGQSAFHNLDQGTMIIVEEGAVNLLAHLYIAGLMFPQSIQLRSRQSYCIEATQDYQLQANTTTKITLIPPTRHPNIIWKYLRARAASFKREAVNLLIFCHIKI
jgi:hypothetical protein